MRLDDIAARLDLDKHRDSTRQDSPATIRNNDRRDRRMSYSRRAEQTIRETNLMHLAGWIAISGGLVMERALSLGWWDIALTVVIVGALEIWGCYRRLRRMYESA